MDTNSIELTKYFPDVTFGNGVQVIGIRGIEIGAGSCISDDVWLNDCIRDGKIRIKIGKCVLVGRRGVVSTAGELEIGSYTIFGPNVYFSDADHVYNNIEVPIILGGVTDGRKVVVEENCWLCINTVVSGNVTIGRGSVVGANSVVLSDVPPFTVVVGNPAKIIKMYDPSKKEWIRIKTEDDKQLVMENRQKIGIYSREEYLELLSKCGLEKIDPAAAGNRNHIF